MITEIDFKVKGEERKKLVYEEQFQVCGISFLLQQHLKSR